MRNKPIVTFLPDSESHGMFTEAMIRDLITDKWLTNRNLKSVVNTWAQEWGTPGIQLPTPTEICDAIFASRSLEWSRISHFQDRSMVLLCEYLLKVDHPLEKRSHVYLQGTPTLTSKRRGLKVFCSPFNHGASSLTAELNKRWPNMIQLVPELESCDLMLLSMNDRTFNDSATPGLVDDITRALEYGVHLQLAHEFPSCIADEEGCERYAAEFKNIMERTPSRFKWGETNIYKAIAISLKGSDWRDVGLTVLAQKLTSSHVQSKEGFHEEAISLDAAASAIQFANRLKERAAQRQQELKQIKDSPPVPIAASKGRRRMSWVTSLRSKDDLSGDKASYPHPSQAKHSFPESAFAGDRKPINDALQRQSVVDNLQA